MFSLIPILAGNALLWEILTPLFAAAGTALAAFLSYGLTRLAQWLRGKTDNERLTHVINMIEEITRLAIKATNQTYAEQLKKDGKFDAEAQKIAFEKTMASIKKSISEETMEFIGNHFGNVDQWLTVLIEGLIKEIKRKEK